MRPIIFFIFTSLVHSQTVTGVFEVDSVFEVTTFNPIQQKFTITPEFSFNLANLDFTSVLRFRGDLKNSVGPFNRNNHQSDWSKDLYNSKSSDLELRELYTDLTWYHWDMRLGKQQIVWGQADGLKVLDKINPQSFNEFILEDFDDSRIAQWSMYFERQLTNDRSLQLFTILDSTFNEMPIQRNEYRPTTKYFIPDFGHSTLFNEAKRGSGSIENATYGLQVSEFKNGWDLTYNYLYFHHHNPVLYSHINNGNRIVSPEYERSHLFGASASNSFDDLTLRFEVAYVSDSHQLSKDINQGRGIVEGVEKSYVLGLDWTKFNDTLLSFQLFQSHTNNSKFMIRDEVDTKLSFMAKKDYLNETLISEMFYLYSLNDGDGLFRPKISYELDTNQKLVLSMDIFHGIQTGLFGQFSKKDKVKLSYQCSF